MIPSLADLMLSEMRNAVDLVVSVPGGAEQFQQRLIEAEKSDAHDMAALASLISLAHAAQVVADAGIGPSETWYRDMAKRLLRRSMDVIAMIEADRAPRPIAGLN